MTSNLGLFERSLQFQPKNECTLDGDEMQEVIGFLELEGNSVDKLRDKRNYLVLKYSPILTYLISKGSADEVRKEYYRVNDLMSALTGVIDHLLFKMGAPV